MYSPKLARASQLARGLTQPKIKRNSSQLHAQLETSTPLLPSTYPTGRAIPPPPSATLFSIGSGSTPKRPNGESERISDIEWDLRVGRAIFLIQSTLPEFFSSGLITSSDTKRSTPLAPLGLTKVDGHVGAEENIYSKTIRLTYTPPLALPPPLPHTLHIEGLSLYLASAGFIRTSMMALYSNCAVDLTRASVISEGRRERQLKVGMLVNGKSRLTGSSAEWDIRCTYTFSPTSGLVQLHEVQSIDPAPHSTVYNALQAALARLLGPQEPRVSGDKCPTSPIPTSSKS